MSDKFDRFDLQYVASGEKKKSRRKSFQGISRTTIGVRLRNGSVTHIKRMVKELKGIDPNFANDSAAIRHYVNIGIAAETATSDLRNSLDNSIIKRSINIATKKEVDPIALKLVTLTEQIKNLMVRNNEHFDEMTRHSDNVAAKIDAGQEMFSEAFVDLQITTDETLRNAIMLRVINYIFLFGHKTSRIDPGVTNTERWKQIIYLVHDKVNRLSMMELKQVKNEEQDRLLIQRLTKQIFNETRDLEQPALNTKPEN